MLCLRSAAAQCQTTRRFHLRAAVPLSQPASVEHSVLKIDFWRQQKSRRRKICRPRGGSWRSRDSCPTNGNLAENRDFSLRRPDFSWKDAQKRTLQSGVLNDKPSRARRRNHVVARYFGSSVMACIPSSTESTRAPPRVSPSAKGPSG